MNDAVFIPKVINVGFQERKGTFTGRLAYVIYHDHKGVLRKKQSWNSWKNNKIEPEEYDNKPTEGFVLNKKVGGVGYSSWNSRQTYTRVFDPRGFEFEITVSNLLYILENTNCIKGKGLEGDFVYGWDGADLLLIPCGAPDYPEMVKLSEAMYSNNEKGFKGKDLILGAIYKTNKNVECVYLGRFDFYEHNWKESDRGKLKGKRYFFRTVDDDEDDSLVLVTGLKGRIVAQITDEAVSDYAELMDDLEREPKYSPVDPEHVDWVPYTEEELSAMDQYTYLHCLYQGDYFEATYYPRNDSISVDAYNYSRPAEAMRKEISKIKGLLEIHKVYPLHRKVQYLLNGKVKRKGRYD